VVLSRKVLAGNDNDREQYLDNLRSGCSRYPVDTIKSGGVEMIALFGHLIDQTEELLD
jgi:oligoendopeptidase F